MPPRRQRRWNWLMIAGSVLLACAPRHGRAVELIGYVPSHRMGDANYVNNVLTAQLALLDEVRYFGITVTGGGLLTTTAANLAHMQTIQQKINSLPPHERPRRAQQ